MRGRKRKKGAYTKTFSIKISVEQHQMLQMNEEIKKQITAEIRKVLDIYTKPFLKFYAEK